MEERGYEFQKKRQMILEKARFEAQLACREYEWRMSVKVKAAADLWMWALSHQRELSSVVLPSEPTCVSVLRCVVLAQLVTCAAFHLETCNM